MKGKFRTLTFKTAPKYQELLDFIPQEYQWKYGMQKSELSNTISFTSQHHYITMSLLDITHLTANIIDGHISIHNNHGVMMLFLNGMVMNHIFKPYEHPYNYELDNL
jgi:hypothetical protein